MLVIGGHVHARQFRPCIEEHSNLCRIASVDGFGEPCHVCSIDERFKSGPTFEIVGARQHALCIVEGESCWVGIAFELLNFRNRSGIAGTILRQKILGLLAQLF